MWFKRHYGRRIPGNGEYGAVCSKPELSKKTKKAKAEHQVGITMLHLIELQKKKALFLKHLVQMLFHMKLVNL